MNQEQWTAVDRYIGETVVPSDPALDAAIEASAKAELPAIAVTPNQGKLLQILAHLVNAQKGKKLTTAQADNLIASAVEEYIVSDQQHLRL